MRLSVRCSGHCFYHESVRLQWLERFSDACLTSPLARAILGGIDWEDAANALESVPQHQIRMADFLGADSTFVGSSVRAPGNLTPH